MSTPPAPRKRLPVNPSAEHLRKQAKRRAKRDAISLADAQHYLAREYGCRHWAELMHVVVTMSRGADQLVNVRRALEPLPKAARQRDLDEVRRLLASGEYTMHDLDAALAHAAWYGGDEPAVLNVRSQIFDLLLEHGADPDGQYGSNYGPIVFGCGECLDVHGLRWLIKAGADVTFAPVETKYGRLCLLDHVLGTYVRGRNERKHEMIDLLLAAGTPVPAHVTPPIMAIHRGDAAQLGDLLDAEPSLVHRSFAEMPYGNLGLRGGTLLHCAAEFGEIACCEVLLKRGADPNVRMPGGLTPLHLAARNGSVELIELLQTHRALAWISDDEGRTAADHARQSQMLAELAKSRIIELLTNPRIDDPVFRRAVDAIDAGDLETLQGLLRQHPRLATIHAEEDHGSFAGAYFARPALLWFVANNPIRIETMPRNIIEITEALIDAGAMRDDITYTLGLVSSGSKARDQGLQIPLIELLVRRGGDPSRALDAAVQEREREAIDVLLRLGANPSLPAAAGLGNLGRVREVLATHRIEAGGTWSPEVGDAVTAAWYNAAVSGQTACVEALLEAGVIDVNVRVAHGTTALHLAAYNGHRELAERLLALEADLSIRDSRYDSTPAGWAEHAGHGELAKWLRERELERTRP